MRKAMVAAILVLWFISPALAQQGWRFQWKKGQVLTYRAEHITTVAETLNNAREETTSKLKLTKQWKVLDVDDAGAATLQLTLTAMRNEQVRPNGETLLFDSAGLDKSTPALKEHMQKFIGTPLAEIRIDPTGKVLEAKQGGDRYESELPFQIILPTGPITRGQSWERPFTITLHPPLGTGEKYHAVQRCECTEMNGHFAKIAIKTTIKNLPESQQDQMPLFPKMPEGAVIFNHHTGLYHGAHLRIVRQLQDHQGKGSSYHFESDFREEFVP